MNYESQMRTQSEAIQDWRRKNKYSLPVEEGVLMAVTEVFRPTRRFARYAPYWIGIIELKRKDSPYVRRVLARVVGQLVRVDMPADRQEGWTPKIGDRVRATRRILFEDGEEGVIHYGIKWERML